MDYIIINYFELPLNALENILFHNKLNQLNYNLFYTFIYLCMNLTPHYKMKQFLKGIHHLQLLVLQLNVTVFFINFTRLFNPKLECVVDPF